MGTGAHAASDRWRLKPLAAAIIAAGALAPDGGRSATLTVATLAESSLSSCTLRDALDSINGQADQGACTAAGAYGSSDTVGFTPGLTGTITFLKADPLAIPAGSSALVIRRPMSVQGPGSGSLTLQCNVAFRLLEINATAGNVGISGLTIANCRTPFSGGGIIASNVIQSLQLTDVTLRNNRATQDGGGMAVFGSPGATITMTACTLNNNTATSDGGGMFVTGSPDISVTDSTISNNVASSNGGGANLDAGRINFTRSTIAGNRATSLTATGGGLFLSGSGISVSVFDSTVSSNRAATGGGVALVGSFQPQHGLTLTNSTVSGNTASDGAGVYMSGGNTGSLLLANSTIANNQSGWGVVVENTISSGGMTVAGAVNILDTIVAGNTPADTHSSEPVNPGGVMAWNVSWSLIGAPDNVPLSGTGNIVGGPPPFGVGGWLGPLQNNGGSTQTHALLTNVVDPAIDAGDPSFFGLAFDQRGPPFRRVVNGRVDIGAFEAGSPPASVTEAIPVTPGPLLVLLSGLLAWLGWRLRPRR
jgi:hypothetical protein